MKDYIYEKILNKFNVNTILRFWMGSRGFLFVILLVALAVRIWGIDSRDVWYDEALTILQSNKSISQINIDVPTPVHYYFVHVALLFGRSTLILGLPSVILGLLTIVLVYASAKKLSGTNVALVTAFLLAISPMHIEFSQQILFFSYFVFFSSLILYLVIDFVSHLNAGKLKWGHLLLLVFVNWINVLTQMLALVLIPVQLVFFCFLFAKNPKSMIFFRKYAALILALVAVLFSSLLFIGSGGYALFLKTLHIGFERPITVGYSLSSQLGSTVIDSPVKFSQAMFSWFGIGEGIGFLAYMTLFFVGAIVLFWRKISRLYALFFFLWLSIPFLVLFSVRMEHWFEEKYFIFMIPVYLIVIASGIVFISGYLGHFFGKKIKFLKSERFAVFFIVIILVGISSLAIEPIKTRTTFGFPVEGFTEYSWRKVDDFLGKRMKEGDRVFVSRDNTMFLKYYFSLRDKKIELIEDTHIAGLSSDEEYRRYTEGSGKNYYVSIPDYQYLFLADTTNFKKIKSVGNFGIYEIDFKKQTPVTILPNLDKSWMYYEDFRTARFILESSSRQNLATTYSGMKGMPKTEGYNELVPLSSGNAFIEYDFIFPKGTKTFNLNTHFSLDRGVTFKVYQRDDGENEMRVIYEKSHKDSSSFSPTIISKITSPKVSLRFSFESDEREDSLNEATFLKSFLLYDFLPGSARTPDYDIKVVNGKKTYSYDSQLEVIKNNKWVGHTTENVDWIQTMDGVLIRQNGQNISNPLVYKFEFEEIINTIDLNTKIFAHFSDPMSIYYSVNGKDWIFLQKVNDNITKNYNFKLEKLMSKALFVKFTTEIPGPFSHMRDIKFTAYP